MYFKAEPNESRRRKTNASPLRIADDCARLITIALSKSDHLDAALVEFAARNVHIGEVIASRHATLVTQNLSFREHRRKEEQNANVKVALM